MRRTASAGISLLLATSLLQAQVVAPGSWEKVNALPPGNQIIITLKSGVRMEGAFQDSSRHDLALTAPTGGEQRVLKADIQGVIGEKKDSVVDGPLLGAAIGAGAGVVVGYDRRTFECRAGCSIQIGVTLFTPIGALVGWLRDRKQNQTEVLYQAPSQTPGVPASVAPPRRSAIATEHVPSSRGCVAPTTAPSKPPNRPPDHGIDTAAVLSSDSTISVSE